MSDSDWRFSDLSGAGGCRSGWRCSLRRLGSLALGCLVLAMAPSAPLRAASLQPLDVEGFRARYGQEALFRLRLGVDAAIAPSPGAAGGGGDGRPPGPCEARTWAESAEQRQYTQAVEQQRYFDAGQALGRWQRRQGSCP